MNIGLTGASGFLGRKILDLALRRGHEIIAFTRHPEHSIPGCTMRAFSLETALMIEKRAYAQAFTYTTASVILSVAAIFAGFLIARRIFAA